MAFFPFGRKSGPESLPVAADSGPGARPAPSEADAKRDFARQMAARIDQIESEMMEAPGGLGRVAPAGPRDSVPLPDVPVPTPALAPEIEAAALLFAEGCYREASTALDPLLAGAGDAGGLRLAWEVRLDALRVAGDASGFAAALEAFALAEPLIADAARAWPDAPGPADCSLSGTLTGPDASGFACLADRLQGGGAVVTVDCARLDRIDFAAAGAMLNLAIAFARTGRQLVFDGAGAGVAALMTAIGIADVAEVRRRRIEFPHSSSGRDRS